MINYMDSVKRLQAGAWGLSILVTFLAIYVWGQSLDWQFSGLTIYEIFPVLGLIAFSIMWSHYIVSVVRQYLDIDREATKKYFETTSMVVLIAIVLHPGLLIYQLYRDGLGLPPGSYYKVYGWLAILGTVSWFAFIAFEFRRKFGQKKWWPYVGYAGDAAMLAIFYHGLKLGTQLHIDWFRWVWYFYGLTLIGALAYIYAKKLTAAKRRPAL